MIVLGIDQAKRSGWAIHNGLAAHVTALQGLNVPCPIAASGFVHDTGGLVGVIEMAKALAHGSEFLAVFEDHSGIPLQAKAKFARGQAPQRNAATILGMGAARGRWELALDLAEHPERLRLEVTPRDWRGRVLGLVPSASTERCKATACVYASRLIGHQVTDDNEAEAICIACWGALDGLAQLSAVRAERNMKARLVKAARKQGGLPW